MRQLSGIRKEYALPVQSHLSENRQEIDWVKQLVPASKNYGDAYRCFDLFGGDAPTIMAHCVWSSDAEILLMKERQVFVAHCPQSNTNLRSGAAPVRCYLAEGLRIGLGSDVAGGVHLSIFRAAVDAIQVSKLRSILMDNSDAPLSCGEAFYLATKGGGAFCGIAGGSSCGSFENAYDADILVLDDRTLLPPYDLSIEERLERVIYLSDDRHIKAKYVRGRLVG
jgi:guanine deaminase